MDSETSDLVAEPLGGDDDDFFEDVVVVEVDGHARWPGLLHGLGADSSHGSGGGVWRVLYMCVPEGLGVEFGRRDTLR